MRADWEREALAAVEDATRERVITHEQMVTAVADALEPLIRADERERQEDGWAARLNSTVAWAENGVRDALRAKVKALPSRWHTRIASSGHDPWVLRADVLALLDGGSDE